jgi:cytosine/adenosine deaminase-related metal-dependent hydrolase
VAPSPTLRVGDARGKYVIPGLWDMHVHFADPGSGRLFITNGVTGVRVMWGNPPYGPGMERFHFRLRDAFDSKKEVGPRMVIASQLIDGPHSFWPDATMVSTPDEARRAVDDAKSAGVDFIKVYSRLSRDAYFAIADESKRLGLPFAGHVPEAVSVAEASDAGQKSMEHLLGMLVACSSHEAALRRARATFAAGEHTSSETRPQATTTGTRASCSPGSSRTRRGSVRR